MSASADERRDSYAPCHTPSLAGPLDDDGGNAKPGVADERRLVDIIWPRRALQILLPCTFYTYMRKRQHGRQSRPSPWLAWQVAIASIGICWWLWGRR